MAIVVLTDQAPVTLERKDTVIPPLKPPNPSLYVRIPNYFVPTTVFLVVEGQNVDSNMKQQYPSVCGSEQHQYRTLRRQATAVSTTQCVSR